MDKIRFITIGFIEHHKAQDVLVNAVRMLDEDAQKKSEFLIVGDGKSLFARNLCQEINLIPSIKVIGVVDRSRIHSLLDESDVLICPSREDSMPTVCAEAMQHKVPCIMSDAVGTADYIQDGVNGLIFHSEDASDLNSKIMWCINNREKLRQMGAFAYKVYESHFSMRVFEKQIMHYVTEMIGE